MKRNFPKKQIAGVLVAMFSSALADHVPPVGLDYKGTWVVLIAVGTIIAMLILAILWAYLDGQFNDPERIKYKLITPDEGAFSRGTSIERPIAKEA